MEATVMHDCTRKWPSQEDLRKRQARSIACHAVKTSRIDRRAVQRQRSSSSAWRVESDVVEVNVSLPNMKL